MRINKILVMIIIGYSGHSFVACGILQASGVIVKAYCDFEEKAHNPYNLAFLGSENDEAGHNAILSSAFFIGVGNNGIRKKVYERLAGYNRYPVNAVHPSAVLDDSSVIAEDGVMISAGVIINPLAKIESAAICNTGSIIEHECFVGKFAHIGPGAVFRKIFQRKFKA